MHGSRYHQYLNVIHAKMQCVVKNLHTLGNYLLDKLRSLMAKHDVIGDVRGKGLMIGVELVEDRNTKAPAKAACASIFERAKDLGLLLGKGGFTEMSSV